MAVDGVLSSVKVGFSEAGPPTWTKVPQLTNLGFPEFSPDEVDTTVYGSRYKRYIRGLIDVGEMTLECIADLGNTSVHRTLRQKQLDGTTLNWRVEIAEDRAWSSWAGWEFRGWVKSWNLSTDQGDVVKLTITVRFDDTTITESAPGPSEIS